MRHPGFWLIAAGVMATTVSAAAQPAPGPYPMASPDDWSPDGYSSLVVPELFGRAAEMLGAINGMDDRSRLAQDWLSFLRKVIVEDIKHRRQWLDLQRQRLAQAQQVEQLKLEVARLQKQVEQLRARTVPSRRPGPAGIELPSGGPPTAVPRGPSPQESK